MRQSQVTTKTSTERIDIRLLAPLWATAFVGMLWLFAARPFVRRLADDLGTSVSLIGLMTTAAMITIALAGLFSGPVADHIGHRRSIIIGLLVMSGSAVAIAASLSVVMLLGAALVGGVGFSMLYGVALGVVSKRSEGEAQRRALGYTQAIANVGSMMSAPILTLVAAVALWRGSFLVVAVTIAGVALLVYRILPCDRNHDASPISVRLILRAYRPLLTHHAVVALFGASALRGLIIFGVPAYLAAYYEDHFGLSLQAIGIATMVEGIGLVAGTAAGGRFFNGIDQRLLFAAGMVGIGIGWMAIYALGLPVLFCIALAPVMAFLTGMTSTTMAGLLAQETPCGSATTMTLNVSLIATGAAFGAAIGGGILSVGGYPSLGLGVLPFALIAAGLVWRPQLSAVPIPRARHGRAG